LFDIFHVWNYIEWLLVCHSTQTYMFSWTYTYV